MLSNKTKTERRDHKRYRVKGHMVIVDTDQCGPIIDLSMGGLAFRYAAPQADKNDGKRMISATLIGEDFCLAKVPLETISIATIEKNGVSVNRCNVRFGELDAEQKKRIKNFIIMNSLDAAQKVLKKKYDR
jgi:c-di-GMP-binding flagellar brake protein YcgR